jgi:hypothetical protein
VRGHPFHFFPFVVLAAAYASVDAFRALRNAAGITYGVAMVCFQPFPEHIPRPDIGSLDNAFLQQRLIRPWQLDFASNGGPSLHLAVTCLAGRALCCVRYRRWVGRTCLMICLSNLTLKRQTLIDVAGSLLLALVCALATQTQGSSARAPA